MARLRQSCSNIVGVKDAMASMPRATKDRQVLGEDFIMLSGEDMTALGYNAHGGKGCISVTSNIAPALCAQFQSYCTQGNFPAALKIQDKLAPLHEALFIDPNPSGVKYAAQKLGLCTAETRLPIVALSEEVKPVIDAAMAHAGLI